MGPLPPWDGRGDLKEEEEEEEEEEGVVEVELEEGFPLVDRL